jgi:hypothetical protein
LILSKNGTEIRFDIRVETATGFLWAACLKRKTHETNASSIPLSVNQAHLRFDQMCEESTRTTAKLLGWTLSVGAMIPCEDCAIRKGRQKNLPKDTGDPVASLDASRV